VTEKSFDKPHQKIYLYTDPTHKRMRPNTEQIHKLLDANNPEETTVEEKEKINRETVRRLLLKEKDDVPLPSYQAQKTAEHLIETARWAFAMDDVYPMSTRRLAAQKKVAAHQKPTGGRKSDSNGENIGITLQAVQKKVRRVFGDRYANPQEHLDTVLEDVEEHYQACLNAQ
jgi:hypothetical protein